MLRSVKGIYRDGKIELLEEVPIKEGVDVIVTILETSPARRSIVELSGLGSELWKSIDAEEYVRKERDTWGE